MIIFTISQYQYNSFQRYQYNSVIIARQCLDDRLKDGTPGVLCMLGIEKAYAHFNRTSFYICWEGAALERKEGHRLPLGFPLSAFLWW